MSACLMGRMAQASFVLCLQAFSVLPFSAFTSAAASWRQAASWGTYPRLHCRAKVARGSISGLRFVSYIETVNHNSEGRDVGRASVCSIYRGLLLPLPLVQAVFSYDYD